MPHDDITVAIRRSSELEGAASELLAAPRPEFVVGIKALRAREWQRVREFQLGRINEITGFDVVVSLAAVVDVIVLTLLRRALLRCGPGEEGLARCGLIALGGYGRGEHCPGSDIDILLLGPGKHREDWLQPVGQELQTLLWDCGFKVGGHIRSVGELEQILADDFVTGTAVLEQRVVSAPPALAEAMVALRDNFRRRHGRRFLLHKVEEVHQRRARAGANLFLLEPDLKLNPGGLRDVQFLRNASFILTGSRNLHALRDLEVIGWGDVQGLLAGNDHLLGLRSLLHFEQGRLQDVLRLTDQLTLARLLGYVYDTPARAVEVMMRMHYHKTFHIHQMTELVIGRLQALGHLGRRRLLVTRRRSLDDDFDVIDGRVYVSRTDFWQLDDAPVRVMAMLRRAQRRGAQVSLELQRAIRVNSFRFSVDEVRCDPRMAALFLEIIADTGRVRPILEDMHWSGLLGAYLPEFGHLTCHMQFDSYHRYTVDEHTLISLGHLDRVWSGRARGLPGMSSMLRRVARRDLLALGLLLHDVGKFMGSGHVQRGALMVHPVAQRLGLAEDEAEIVHFLVLQHVTLSDASRTRDISDPGLLARLATAIGSRERLELLYCLTYADIEAVGEAVLTGWQQELLGELYANLTRVLPGVGEPPPPSRRRQLLQILAQMGHDVAAHVSFIDSMPESYLYQVALADVPLHRQLLERAQVDGFVCDHRLRDGHALLTTAATWRHGLTADITATISAQGLDIVDAHAWVDVQRPLALHVIRLAAAAPGLLAEERTWRRLSASLTTAVAEGRDSTRVSGRCPIIRADAPPDSGDYEIELRLDQEGARDATVLDVRVRNTRGLLAMLCRTISDAGCDIQFMAIATYGDLARDAFYIVRNGRRLNSREAIELRKVVQQSLMTFFDVRRSGS